MGAMAEAFAAFAQPLIEQTDGSLEQLNSAFAMSTLCYNLALLPPDQRGSTLNEMRPSLKLNDEEFEEFRSSIIEPMIRRHEEMFPLMHRQRSFAPSQSGQSQGEQPTRASRGEKYPGTPRYAPCPCNSGEKYKFCCGAKRG
jgi:hypothetical protein